MPLGVWRLGEFRGPLYKKKHRRPRERAVLLTTTAPAPSQVDPRCIVIFGRVPISFSLWRALSTSAGHGGGAADARCCSAASLRERERESERERERERDGTGGREDIGKRNPCTTSFLTCPSLVDPFLPRTFRPQSLSAASYCISPLSLLSFVPLSRGALYQDERRLERGRGREREGEGGRGRERESELR